MAVIEPEWRPDDVALLLASRELDVRGGHGHLLAEAMSPDADPANAAGSHYYVAGPAPRVDWAERARLDAIDRFKEANPTANMNGYHFPVRRIDRQTNSGGGSGSG